MTTDLPKTLLEAVRYFSDLDVCHTYMRRIKWPSGRVVCPHCESDRIGEIATRRLMRCKECESQFSEKVGTLLEDSPLLLSQWFPAIWCVATGDNVSSPMLARAIGVTQKTAWLMLERIRAARQLTHDAV